MVKFIEVTCKKQYTQLEQLGREIWEQHYMELLGQEQIDYMLEKFQSIPAITQQIKDGYQYFFITVDNEAQGYIAIDIKNDRLFLSKLYLRESMRGRGIARMAFAFLHDIAAQNHLDKIWLTVNRNNDSSIAVYKKLGFQIDYQQDAAIGNGYVMDDYVMSFNLQAK